MIRGMGFMGKMSRWNDIFFAVIATAHLLTRQWPTGGTLQSIVDVMLGTSAVLILFKYYMEYKRTGSIFGGEAKNSASNQALKAPAAKKKKRRR